MGVVGFLGFGAFVCRQRVKLLALGDGKGGPPSQVPQYLLRRQDEVGLVGSKNSVGHLHQVPNLLVVSVVLLLFPMPC